MYSKRININKTFIMIMFRWMMFITIIDISEFPRHIMYRMMEMIQEVQVEI